MARAMRQSMIEDATAWHLRSLRGRKGAESGRTSGINVHGGAHTHARVRTNACT
jgi:hypothetical protein